jgi:hypothetical protein
MGTSPSQTARDRGERGAALRAAGRRGDALLGTATRRGSVRAPTPARAVRHRPSRGEAGAIPRVFPAESTPVRFSASRPSASQTCSVSPAAKQLVPGPVLARLREKCPRRPRADCQSRRPARRPHRQGPLSGALRSPSLGWANRVRSLEIDPALHGSPVGVVAKELLCGDAVSRRPENPAPARPRPPRARRGRGRARRAVNRYHHVEDAPRGDDPLAKGAHDLATEGDRPGGMTSLAVEGSALREAHGVAGVGRQ